MLQLLILAAALSAEVDLTGSPVTKVVALLEDMRTSLNEEAKTDEELYEKLSCWCETNGGNKKGAISTAEKRIGITAQSIEELTGKKAELKATIARVQKEQEQNNGALAKADGIRSEESAEFSKNEAELSQSLSMVSGAVDALSKHHEFLQVGARTALSAVARRATDPDRRQQLEAFLAERALPSGGSYNSRSGAIFGIMDQMKDEFTEDLSRARKDERASQATFDALERAKQAEISEGREMESAKTQELAETEESLAHAKHDLKKTRAALSADQKFLMDLQKRCADADAEYEERRGKRQEELVGVGEAITILTDDSARDTFSSTLSFAQISARSLQQQVAASLRTAAQKTGSSVLLELASSASLDAFTKVTASINEMIVELQKQQEEEVVHQRFCTKELQKNGAEQADKQKKIKHLSLSLEEMAADLDTLTKDIKTLEDQVAEAERQVKRASEDRSAENAEFQQTVSDQRATQTILQKALDRLGEVYNKGALVQVRISQEPGAAAPPPPAGFKEYKQQASGGVLALIQQVINEAKQLEQEALHAEQTNQKSYEAFVQDSATAMGAKRRTLGAKRSEKAELEQSSVAAEASRRGALADLESLARFNGELHTSCDFVLNNFEARQTARAQETDALNNAKAILSGATFE